MAKATPAEIALYGPIATRLRAFLTERKMIPPDLSEKLGLSRASATPYKWLSARGAPAPALRAKLSKITGIPEIDLQAAKREIHQPRTASGAIWVPPRRNAEILSFTITTEGEARIKLDITLPLATATPLLRMLLDAGIVFGEGAIAPSRATL